MSEREEGFVIWFDGQKGYGFACPLGVSETDRTGHLFLSAAA